jgi:hypothetical protein
MEFQYINAIFMRHITFIFCNAALMIEFYRVGSRWQESAYSARAPEQISLSGIESSDLVVPAGR